MFCENLKLLRKEKGISQEELATRLNVVRQTVSKWEKGLSVPDAELLIKLSEILETTVAALLGETFEAAADNNVISRQLERLNEQFAEKNKRSRLIWKTIAIVLIISAALYFLYFISHTYNPSGVKIFETFAGLPT